MMNHSVTQLTNNQKRSGAEHVPVDAITAVLSVLIVLSILGNSLICCAFVVQPRLRRVVYYPVLNLAIADILCGLVAMTSYLAKKHVSGGVKEQVVCDISRFSYFVTEYASVLSLTVISVDRALAILKPLTYTTMVTSKRIKAVLGLVWCYSFLVSSLPFFWQNDRHKSNCVFRPTKIWSICVILVNVLVPFLIILMCQGSIYVIALKHCITIKKQEAALRAQLRRGSCPRTEAWVNERKATVGLSAVVGLFVVCWGPSSVYYFLQNVSPERFKGTFGSRQGTFNAVVKLLTFANSCFNPLIYAWMNSDFRHAFLRVLSRRLHRSAVETRANRSGSHAASFYDVLNLHLNQTSKLI